jgi:hypothetical protein
MTQGKQFYIRIVSTSVTLFDSNLVWAELISKSALRLTGLVVNSQRNGTVF